MKKAAKNIKKVAAPRPDTDWDAIRLAVAVGQLSQAVIARSHGITPARLSQKIKEMGWPKGTLFNATVKKVKEKLIPEFIPENTVGFNDKFNTSYAREREERAIKVAAAGAIQVVRYHRSLLGRAQSVAETLLLQLETAINHRPLLEDIAIELTKGVDDTVTLAVGNIAGIYGPTSNTTGSYKISWNISNTAGVAYILEENINGGGWATVTPGPGTKNYHNFTAKPVGSYSYRVTATKATYKDSPIKGPVTVIRP